MKKLSKSLVFSTVAVLAAVSLSGCTTPVDDGKLYTYNTYTTLSPSNWNELTYQDNNDTQIMQYIGGSFFGYDFKFDEKGKVVPGEYEVVYTGATKLEDVSADYVGDEWGIPAEATGRAYKITLREDLKWDDGTAIKAEDFVYTMQEQLAPEFQNYRADSFYLGGTVIHNAKNYFYQGQTVDVTARDRYEHWDATSQADAELKFTVSDVTGVGSYIAANYASYVEANGMAWTMAALLGGTKEGYEALDGKTWAEISADATLTAHWEAALAGWKTLPDEELDFFAYEYTYPAVAKEEIGIFVGDKANELVVVLDKALPLLKEDGSLDYRAAYNFSSLPLVHKEKYEANKHEPVMGSTLWTSTYNSDVESTASWGPYKLTFFQSGKQYTLERNEHWYGYNMPENEGLYQTDKIVCKTVKDWNSAWVLFQSGEIDGIGIDVTIAEDYKGSDRAYFTPSDFVASMQLQSNVTALKNREDSLNASAPAGTHYDKELLTYVDFRKALSLAVDREKMATDTTTSSKAGFGLFNSMHYNDVANGGVYRNSDEAKQVLCDIYGVDVSEYESLDAAHAAITGYDPEQAKELINSAVAQAIEDEKYAEGDLVHITMGSGALNDTVTRRFDFVKKSWEAVVEGTALEGKLVFGEYEDHGDNWAKDFKDNGAYDVCFGGWTGAAWDPGYFLLAYLHPNYMYSKSWPTNAVEMTFTMKGVGENGADVTETMSLLDWYDCLNGEEGAKYDWSSNTLEESQRLQLIAALEKEVLKVYYSVPLYNDFSASLISYKVDYVTYEYNTFMSYGGIKYMTYNYNNEQWDAVVEENNNIIDYK